MTDIPPAGRDLGLDYDVVPPDPSGTIESLGALGYSLEAAVADIVDNSIDAKASQVAINFHWAGKESYVSIWDDGIGMSTNELIRAMAVAAKGPQTQRRAEELGRFGMGLKTASFSQASLLLVWTKSTDGKIATRVWDLDHVVETREWRLLHSPKPALKKVVEKYARNITQSGTIVIWSQLTKLTGADTAQTDQDRHATFLEAVGTVHQHLAMTFGRLLGLSLGRKKRKLSISINGVDIAGWDPFMTNIPATTLLPAETLPPPGRVLVHPYTLPPKRSLTDEMYKKGGGPNGWLDQQGFYVYRNDRLIVAGSWLGLAGLRKDPKHVLARIAINLPSTVDQSWEIDVKKASAIPPPHLRRELARIAKATRVQAQRRLGAITRTSTTQTNDELSYIWRPEAENGDLRLKLNWGHPLIKQALATSPDARPVIRALLRYLEETVPISAMRMLYEPEVHRDYVPFASSPSEELISIAQRMYNAYISSGLTPSQAQLRLEKTPPFNEYPELPSLLNLPIRKTAK